MTGSSPPSVPHRSSALPLPVLVGVSLASWMIVGDLILHEIFPLAAGHNLTYVLAQVLLVVVASIATALIIQVRTRKLLTAERTAYESAAEAHQRNAEIATVFEALPDLYFRLDADGTILDYHVSRESDLYGSSSDLLGKKNHDILPPDVGPLYERAINRAIETGSTETFEYALTIGEEHQHFESRVRAINADEVIAVVRNITGRKHAEQWIETTGAAMDQAPDAVCLINQNGEMLYVNQTACKALQYSREELESMCIADIDPNFPQSKWSEIWDTVKLEGSRIFETVHQRKDKTTFPVEVKSGYLRIGSTEFLCAFARDITERRRAEQVHAEARERFDTAVTASNDGFWDWTSVSGDTEWWSPQIYTMLGYEPGEVSSSHERWVSWLHDDDRDATLEAVQRCLSERKSYDVECRMRTKSGEYRWFRTQGRAIFDSAGKPQRMSGSISDIHDRKLAEKAALDREQEFRVLADNVPVLFSYLGVDRRYKFVNKRYEEWFELSRDQIIGRTYREVLGEATADKIDGTITRVLGGKQIQYEEELPYEHGGSKWIHASFTPNIVDDEVVGFYAIVEDITERKRAEEQLRESEHRLRNLVEGTNVILWEVSLETTDFTYVNSHAERILGYPEQAWYEHDFWVEHMHPDDRTWAPEYCLKETLAKKNHSFEYRMIAADGSVKWFRDLVSIVFEDDNPVGLRGALVDITERKQAEDEVRKSNQALQLLLSELDHRVKNSMSGLLSLIDLTSQNTQTVEIFAESIRRRVETMASTHGLLSDSHWTSIDLRTIIQSLVPSDARGRVVIDGPDLPVSSRQVTAMGMVLQELFTNSSKHGSLSTSAGRVTIHWTCTTQNNDLKVKLNWSETGGPAIVDEPNERLGTQLIRGFAQTELGGQAELRYDLGGARHQLILNLDAIAPNQDN